MRLVPSMFCCFIRRRIAVNALSRAKIVIIGGGFAGVGAAREFERSAQPEIEVTLVNRENFQLFTPMLPEVASGSIDMRAVAQPLRVMLKRTRVMIGEATDVDFHNRTVAVDHPLVAKRSILTFDHIVFALGAETSTLGIRGAEEHTYPLKSLPDAARLRARIGGVFEAAAVSGDLIEIDRLLRFVIVGGGFSGVEAAGELLAYIHRLHGYYHALHDASPRVVIVEHGQQLLEHLPPSFGRYAAASLHRRDVALELGSDVASVDANGITLENGKRFESETVIWTAGVKSAPFVERLGLQTTQHGALIVNGDLSVPGRPGAWGAGDCARVPKKGGGVYAPLAQNADREGPLLARNILATIAGTATTTFRYRPRGQMASLGCRGALAQLPGGRMVTGFAAWLLWRGFYLSRLSGLSRKLRVAADWTLSGLFAQNIAVLPWTSDRLTVAEDHAPEG